MRVAELAAEDWGVVSFGELAMCGLSETEVLGRARRGWLHRVHQGVYAVGHPNLTLEGRFMAAVKACGEGAVLSHASASVLWGFEEWEERLVEVTVPAPSPHEHDGLRIHRSSLLAVGEVARHRGIPVTTPARTLLDRAARTTDRTARRLVRRAQAQRRVNVRQLTEAARVHEGRRGVRRLRMAIARGPAPTRSELEDVVLDLLLAAGIEHPDVNVALHLGGRRVVPDFRWPRERLILEADGVAWHDAQDDAERQALLEAYGEHVLRVTWAQVATRPGAMVARLLAAGAPTDGQEACNFPVDPLVSTDAGAPPAGARLAYPPPKG